MDKQKLAVVSSYDDFCGIASYTKSLTNGLSAHFDVTIVSLDVELLRKGDLKTVDKYVKPLCERLQKFDCVNIQFEATLFGSQIYRIKKNFLAILNANKKVVLTMHRIHGETPIPSLFFLAKSLFEFKLKNYVMAWKKAYINNKWARFYNKVVCHCIQKQVPIIVHTKKDKTYINHRFNYDQVYDHPLSFNDQDHIGALSKSYNRADFCRSFSLDEAKTYIGIFGFIFLVKGHKTAIKAMQHLPSNFELLIFGAQHPHTIKVEEEIDSNIEHLLNIIHDLGLSNRVKFHRIVNDDDFLKAMLGCDFNVLPYIEINQSGSGIGALTLETNSQAIFSQNLSFYELSKYAPNAFKMFSIGNHLELANAILSYRKSDFEHHLKEYHSRYNLSTSALLYKKVLSSINRE